MLDPQFQEELKNANKTVLILHVSMMSEPLVYVIVAFVLRGVSNFKGLEEFQSSLPLIRSIFVLLSVPVIPAIAVLRRRLFSPDRMVPGGADTRKMAMVYSRAQVVVDALAVVPATFGFVLFLIGGGMDYLVVLSAGSIAMLIFLFPRRETLERAVMARVLRGETTRPVVKEFGGNA